MLAIVRLKPQRSAEAAPGPLTFHSGAEKYTPRYPIGSGAGGPRPNGAKR